MRGACSPTTLWFPVSGASVTSPQAIAFADAVGRPSSRHDGPWSVSSPVNARSSQRSGLAHVLLDWSRRREVHMPSTTPWRPNRAGLTQTTRTTSQESQESAWTHAPGSWQKRCEPAPADHIIVVAGVRETSRRGRRHQPPQRRWPHAVAAGSTHPLDGCSRSQPQPPNRRVTAATS
jgi:hypothetical protein